MGWNYKRKASQHRWEEESMTNAVKVVRVGRMGFQMAAYTFRVPMVTLCRRVKKKGDAKIVPKKKLRQFRNVLMQEKENELAEYCFFMEKGYLG
jgi:hypothetical protein